MYRFITLLLSVMLIVGCATTKPVTNPNSTATAVIPSKNEADQKTEPRSLASALTIREKKEEGKTLPIPTDLHSPAIDYKSALEITPDNEELKKIAGQDRDVLPALSPEAKLRVDKLQSLIELTRKVVDEAASVSKEVEVMREREKTGSPPSGQEIADLQKKIGDEAKRRLQVISYLRETAEARAGLIYRKDSKEYYNEIGNMTNRFFRDSQGKRVLLNVEQVAQFLSEEIRSVIETARTDTNIAENQGTVRFRIRAWDRGPGGSFEAIHVENYDDIMDPKPLKEPRFALRMSQSDQARVAEGLRIASSATELINDIRDKDSKLSRDWKALAEEIAEKIKKLDVESIIPSDDLIQGLQDAIAEAQVGANEEEKKEFAELEDFINRIKLISTKSKELKKGLEELKAASDVNSLLSLCANLTASVETVRDLLISVSNYENNLARLDSLQKILQRKLATLATEDKQKVESWLATGLPQSKRFIEALGKYAPLGQAIAKIGSSATIRTFADATGTIDSRVKALTLDKVVPGTINLNDTSADRGHEIVIKAEVVSTEKGEEKVIAEATKSFRVDRFGLVSGFSAHLIFVNRFGDGSPGDPEINFAPAPSTSWTMHYRVRVWPNWPERDIGRRIWSVLDPGLGVNVSALRFENNANFQVGLGGHLTVFNDLLLVGGGYNLNASKDNWYLFLGIGVLEALQGVGNLFGSTYRALPK